MNLPTVAISLEHDRRSYEPGETLSGHYSLYAGSYEEVRSIELSVLWYTEGKGEEDLAVHFFDRVEPQSGQHLNLSQPHKFNTQLPYSPLSYGGMIIKIRWCVRIRVFLRAGKEVFVEELFQLGKVPEPQLVLA